MNTLFDDDLMEQLMEAKYDLSSSLYDLESLGDGDPMVNKCRDEIDLSYNTILSVITELRKRGHFIAYPKIECHPFIS